MEPRLANDKEADQGIAGQGTASMRQYGGILKPEQLCVIGNKMGQAVSWRGTLSDTAVELAGAASG